MIYLLVLPMTFLGASGAFFFKKASAKVTGLISLLFCREFYIGELFYVSGALINILLLRYVQYSILYPMTATVYIWTAVLSYRLLGEKITKRGLFGIAVICVGVVFLTK